MTVSPGKYGDLLSKTLPKLIENDRELEHFAEILESLDRLARGLTPEERAIEALISQLIRNYDDAIELPELPPSRTISFLLEQRGLTADNLLPVFGTRRMTSDVLAGKREPDIAQVRKLAGFFHLSPAAFL